LVILLINRKKINEISIFYLVVSGIYYAIVLGFEPYLNDPITFMILISIPVLLGFVKLMYFKEYDIDVKLSILMTIWFIGTAYGFTKGIRFGMLMVPAFAICFGCAISFAYAHFSRILSRSMNLKITWSKVIVVALLSLLLMNPLKSARAVSQNEMILMNDAWYDSLIGIKQDSDDAIITSWWDFGHWFVSIAERRVTFDGADQGERIHWVGKSLLTENETLTVGILRMLNCGQELAPHVIEKYVKGDTVKAVDILNKIMVQDKIKAQATLKKEGFSNVAIKEVLNVTHCGNLIKQYYIASDDMIGKAGVWAHFGSWDFRKAKMWNTVHKKDAVEGIAILKNEFNMSDLQADTVYNEIITTPGDQWISPWPGYMSGLTGCGRENETISCGNGLKVNTTDMSAYLMTQQGEFKIAALSYVDNATKKFVLKKYDDAVAPYGAALIPRGEGYNSIIMAPELAGGLFTRLFFYDGYGLKHFSILSDKVPLTGGRIQVWKVNWEPETLINSTA
jgi:dolichyl-diphosphooligosaccharide--protein glycosyltransferase